MSVQNPDVCATLCGMNDRHGRANLEQIRILMEDMEAQLDRDWPLVPVERAGGAGVDGDAVSSGPAELGKDA